MGYKGGPDHAEDDKGFHAESLLCTKPHARCCGDSDDGHKVNWSSFLCKIYGVLNVVMGIVQSCAVQSRVTCGYLITIQ